MIYVQERAKKIAVAKDLHSRYKLRDRGHYLDNEAEDVICFCHMCPAIWEVLLQKAHSI